MKKLLLKTSIAFLNLIFLGLGFAITDNLKKALILQICAYTLFGLGGILGIFEYFYGFLLIYSLIALIYIYAFISSYYRKEYKFNNWTKNLFKYIGVVIILKLSIALPVRQYLFEPRKNHGTYFMTDIRKNSRPLYIFWDKDFSKIGHNYE